MLFTKLHKPPITSEHIHREPLIDFLNQNKHKSLTLVSAPAGYGKSIAISCWLDHCECPYGWVSLSNEESNLRTFLDYLKASLIQIFPGILSGFSKLISAPELPPIKIIAEELINELDKIDSEFIIVLDDYHLIRDEAINQLMDVLIKFPPQQMHLVIIGRRDPNLQLHALRTYGRMNDVRMSDLSFNAQETKVFMNLILDTEIETTTLNILERHTEGWVTGLRLAALLATSGEDPNASLQRIKGKTQIYSDYLISEVLGRLDKSTRIALLLTSILNRFSNSLIGTLISEAREKYDIEGTGADFLNWLIKSNLFLIKLDEQGSWYRFHHLFQDLLRSQLKDYFSVEEIHQLHYAASEWFEQHEMFEEAMDHLISIGDWDQTVRVITDQRFSMMNTEQWGRLESWLNKIPEDRIEGNYTLLNLRCFIMDLKGKFFELMPTYEKLGKSLEEDANLQGVDRGEVYALLGIYYLFSDPMQSADYAEKSIKLLPEEATYIRTYALYWIIIGNAMIGNIHIAEQTVEDVVNNSSYPEWSHSRLYIGLSASYFMLGECQKMKAAASRALLLGEKYNLQESIDLAHYFLSGAYYYENDLEKAEHHCAISFESRFVNRLTYSIISSCIQVLIYKHQGKKNKAEQTIQLLQTFVGDVGNASAFGFLTALKLEEALNQNNLLEAKQLLERGDIMELPPLWFSLLPQLVKIKAEVLYGLGDGEVNPLQNLDALYKVAVEKHNVFLQVQLLVLKAMYYWKNDRQEKARELILCSLSLGSTGCFIRTYLNYGVPMRELINTLDDLEGDLYLCVDKLKHFLKTKPKKTIDLENENEALSAREIEVIKLVSSGLRNKEIADKLFLSDGTIKKHIYNINQKLNCNGRISSVKKAESLGII